VPDPRDEGGQLVVDDALVRRMAAGKQDGENQLCAGIGLPDAPRARDFEASMVTLAP
jgi:hypothetical protein